MTDDSAATTAPPTPAASRAACQNCGAVLLGEHCYACGQPVRGLVRHFSSILGDFFDTVFNIDSRVFRTLGPLLLKPGHLSNEYFEGRRVRYVSPVRLFVFLSIVTFFVAAFSVDFGDANINVGNRDNDNLAAATTVAEVERRRDAALKGLAEARRGAGDAPGADAGIVAAETVVRSTAETRIRQLREADARGEPPPAPTHDGLRFNDLPWDDETNPVRIDWLPGFANEALNRLVGRANANVARFQQDPNLFKDAAFSVVPTTLFVLLPLFALMLKLAYVFRRRLYMEHLIVALHSHAFLCLAILMQVLLAMAEDAVAGSPVAVGALDLAEAALWVWMPLYLLLMQKRVYRQGWPMTVLKYCVLGLCYTVLLSLGAAFTMLAGLVWA
jgi:hypothetical protein